VHVQCICVAVTYIIRYVSIQRPNNSGATMPRCLKETSPFLSIPPLLDRPLRSLRRPSHQPRCPPNEALRPVGRRLLISSHGQTANAVNFFGIRRSIRLELAISITTVLVIRVGSSSQLLLMRRSIWSIDADHGWGADHDVL
jgi:hypothetical protein